MRRAMLGAAALVLVLSGCEMRAEITVNEDGSGTLGFSMGVEPAMFAGFPGGEEEFFRGARESLADDPLPWKVTEFREPGLHGIRASLEFRDLEHLRELRESIGGPDGSRGGFGDRFALERTGAGWRLDARGEAASPDAFVPGGAPSLEGELPPGFEGELPGGLGLTEQLSGPGAPDGLDQLLRFEFHVTLPGKATTHNADEVRSSGGRTTFVWRASTTGSGPVSMRAETKAAGAALPLVPIGAAVLVLGLGAFVLMRRRAAGRGPPPVVLEGLPWVGLPAEVPANGEAAHDDETEAAAGGA